MSSEFSSMYNLDFQREVLKLLSSNIKFAMDYGLNLKEEYFETKSLREIFKLIKNYIFTYESEVNLNEMNVMLADLVSVQGFGDDIARELSMEIRTIDSLFIKNEMFTIERMLKFVRRQELTRALISSVDIMEKDGSYEEVLKKIDNAVSIGSGADDGMNFDDLVDIRSQYNKTYNKNTLISTGINGFDNALEGGMAPGEVHTVQAPPKSGKTTYGVHVGSTNVKQGKVVFHASLEVKKMFVMMKYSQNLLERSKSEIMNMVDEEYAYKLKKLNKMKPKLFVNYWTENTANAMHIRSWVCRVRSKYDVTPDLIIIDYDDCLLPISGSTDSMYEDSGNIYADLIGLADYFKCPVLTFSQPKREAWSMPDEGKEITYQFLSHSARKAHRCTSISSLNFSENSDNGTLFVDIVRRGFSKRRIRIKKDFDRSRFIEIR